ncbi:P27 family phage terminase small subunit [Listeria monocytogenes]|nr:P27 family phage terminase small subunit [Listeria monocytogenes]MCD1882683.1 P27 family phage terminase small subunit [Listeria monocytogenes]
MGVFSAEMLKSLMKEGGLKVEYNIKKLEKELLSNIDTTSQKELEKVNRYINLIRIYYELDKSIEMDGAVVVTENGSQKFTKTNPAIQEKNRINTSLLSIERSFIFKGENDNQDGSDLI